MVGKISIEDLPPNVLEKLGIKTDGTSLVHKPVKASVLALGNILASLKGLTNREALWALRTANVLVRGYRKDKEAPIGKERNAKENKAWKSKNG